MRPNPQDNNNTNKNRTSPFSSMSKRPSGFHYDECQIKSNDIMSTFNSKYSKFNSSSDFIKTTFSVIPNSTELINNLKIPLCIFLSPLSNFVDSSTIPLCDYGETYDIPRCKNPNCKAYLNPFVKFIHGSDQWQCNICKSINKVLDYYYCPVDGDGIRLDQNTKAELTCGTYEFKAYKEFWNKDRPPIKISYYFLVDISQSSINSGFCQCVLETIKDLIINGLFYDYDKYEIKICIITFDDQIHFFPVNINNENEQNISMLSINEKAEELFLPTNKDFLLVDVKKYKNKFVQIIENIQNNIIPNNNNTIKDSNRLFDVIKICNLIGDKKGGKILLFSGSNVSGLKIMNVIKKDSNSNINYRYKNTDGGEIGKLGITISINGLSINLFQSCNTDTNLLTLNQIITNSNGNLFFYKNFNPDLHYKNLYNQIRKIVFNPNIFDGGLKLRFSNNFFISEYITPVLLYNKNIIFFPNLDSGQNYSLLLGMKKENEEGGKKELINDEYFYIQASLLYSLGDGKKRIRVYNLCLPFSSNPKDIFNSISSEALSCFLTQYLIIKIYRNNNLIQSVNEIEKRFFELTNVYFNNLNTIKKELDDEMKLFSLYFLGIMKNALFNKNEKGVNNDNDLTTFFRTKIQKSKIEDIICFIYPRIYVLDNILSLQNGEYPLMINNSKESMDSQGTIFLIDNGFELILYLKNNIDKSIINYLFGVNSFNEINLDTANEGYVFDSDEDKNQFKNKIIEIIENIREGKSLYQNMSIIFEGINDKNGNIINDVLIEDNFNRGYPYNYEKFYNKIIFG